MGTESEIPLLDFRKVNGVTLEEGSEGWKEMSKKVREAFESHGCFLLLCDQIPNDLRGQIFTDMKSLFDLPEETKKKFSGAKAYRGYTANSHVIPHCQSFGIDDALKPDTTENFTNLMWRQGNPTFCETLSSLTSKTRDLSTLILKMIIEGFGLPQQYILDVEELNNSNDTRMTRYQLPKENKDLEIALVPHTDKGTLAVICHNEVQGLQVLPKTGEWVDVIIPPNGYIVLVGDMLKAWSNGRFQAPTHRVVTKGDKERLAFILFTVPKEDMTIKVPSELVDDENHPLRYRPFKYEDFIDFHYSTRTEKGVLEEFAGL
ncbi:probable 2-oxoglutarate-dependent dioxygenase AOP1 [Cicer arietinum]|uniref:2-oxoglutarate-dependent dioxygenase DAO n=1 Tax=Cicer arietinum TaxID=3827 RepID=A0A1S2Z1N4_CICAR|nr:probable 2-oxoglutarate-dependent dioxygenase AOP1 [Cicer arietinum]